MSVNKNLKWSFANEKLGGTKQVIRLYHCIVDKNCDSAPVLSFGHCAVFQLQ